MWTEEKFLFQMQHLFITVLQKGFFRAAALEPGAAAAMERGVRGSAHGKTRFKYSLFPSLQRLFSIVVLVSGSKMLCRRDFWSILPLFLYLKFFTTALQRFNCTELSALHMYTSLAATAGTLNFSKKKSGLSQKSAYIKIAPCYSTVKCTWNMSLN